MKVLKAIENVFCAISIAVMLIIGVLIAKSPDDYRPNGEE